ncbi:hypothetical protein MMC17_009492 [Xylographa soralifera]|nr:hypothetical protein [Xylographa soralifera]
MDDSRTPPRQSRTSKKGRNADERSDEPHGILELEQELQQASDEPDIPIDAEALMRGAGLVRFQDDEESRYLGPSSGIAMTRLVMELAKQNSSTNSIKEIVPETKAQEIKDRFARESSKPTSKVYPLISSVAAPSLPTKELTETLVDNYNKKGVFGLASESFGGITDATLAQYLLPVLHEPSFHEVVIHVFQGSTNAYENFTLRMVIAISMQKLDTQYAGLADSYYLAALPFLEDAIRPMNLGTLQCFALIAQYSMVTPTRTASLWIVGLAVRLCQNLGIIDESTIAVGIDGLPLDVLEVDLRRRLFWIIISFEFGLAHSLGRPSAWAVTHDHIDVHFFLPVDDRMISRSGIVPGSPPSMKKRIAIHFFKMRLFQSEIRHKLYLKKRPFPKNDQDPWFVQMEAKLNDWVLSSPKNDEGSGLSEIWFKVRNNTMVVFLYRPSPQVPEPSVEAAEKCFEASKFNICVQRNQISTKSVDLTWIFTQSLFMALNTLLWALSYPEIRKDHPKSEVENHLQTAQEAIFLASERWPGVESALELYDTLIHACLKAYDGNSNASYVIGSPSNQVVSGSHSDITTPPALSSPSTVHSSLSSGHDQPSPFSFNGVPDRLPRMHSLASPQPPPAVGIMPQQSIYLPSAGYAEVSEFNPSSYNNRLPTPLNYGFRPSTIQEHLQTPFHDQNFYLGSIGDQYAQYLQSQYAPQETLDSLDLEQQSELMNTLERDRLAGIFDQMPPTPNFVNGLGYAG